MTSDAPKALNICVIGDPNWLSELVLKPLNEICARPVLIEIGCRLNDTITNNAWKSNGDTIKIRDFDGQGFNHFKDRFRCGWVWSGQLLTFAKLMTININNDEFYAGSSNIDTEGI